MYLEQIQKANDIKKLKDEELDELALEIRKFLIDKISRTGGHLASNLGVVELTMAMHLNFDLPEDKIIWDVGHQSYTHKILTGRKDGFDDLRKYGGMSGFPKRKESDCDAFDTGHSSTSISAGLGYVCARDILGEDYHVISVIGDGSLTGGMAYEALNNAATLKTNFIIVLNDNKMSISQNVGGMSQYLDGLRTAKAYTDLKNAVETVVGSIPVGGDIVSISNLNRQILAAHSTVGMLKVDAARQRVLDINPACVVRTYPIFYTPETADSFDFTQYDYIVDAIDTVTGKLALVERAVAVNKPIICCMGTGNKLDASAFQVADHHCQYKNSYKCRNVLFGARSKELYTYCKKQPEDTECQCQFAPKLSACELLSQRRGTGSLCFS